MKNEKAKHSKNVKNNKAIKIICIIIFIIGIVLLSLYIYNSYKQNYQHVLDSIKIDENDITETKTERMLQLEELKKQNDEIVAWLDIPETKINFPVLQAADNDYYMTHTYNKEYSKDGSIFLDKEYKWEPPSSNLMIYGHNNKNGNMFQELLKYQEEKYYKEHPTIRFTTVQEDATYDIIAAFFSRVYYKIEKDVFRYYFFINAQNEAEYNDFVNNSKKASIYDTGKTATFGEQLMTLSTCEYSQENGRFVVVAKKIN